MTSWTTQHAISSDHLHIITTINIRHAYIPKQNRRTFTNYKKTDWIPTNTHTVNIIFTHIILMADKHNIPTGKIHSNCRLFPDHIVCKITPRKNIRRANTCDPTLELLNEEITSDIQKHKQTLWKEQLDAHWDHRNNTHRASPPTLSTSITFNNKIATTPKHMANCFTKQFTKRHHTRQTDPLTEQHIK